MIQKRFRAALVLALLLVSLAYLLQIASPLRLIVDGIDYLLQASSAADGGGFRVHGLRSVRPPGYPALIFLLVKAGIGKSWAIVALNCLLLGVGCWASYFVLCRSFGFENTTAEAIVLLTLLSFVMVKLVTHPLSDVCFFGASMPCLLLLLQAEADKQRTRFLWLALALPLMAFCVEVRTIGIALIPAFIWAAADGISWANTLPQWMRRHKLRALVLFLALLAMAGWGSRSLLRSGYAKQNVVTLRARGLLGNVFWDLTAHAKEWGELAVNAPLSKLPPLLQVPVEIAGFVALIFCAIGLWVKRNRFTALDCYVLAFTGIVLAWPWSDVRFWLPLLPVLIGYVLMGAQRIAPPRLLRPAIMVYCSLFCLLGLIALGYSTRLTFAGRNFPDLYGDGTLRATYRLVFLGESPKRPEDVSQDAVYLLHRYEWHLIQK
jgi:hypothetical protein